MIRPAESYPPVIPALPGTRAAYVREEEAHYVPVVGWVLIRKGSYLSLEPLVYEADFVLRRSHPARRS